MEKFHRSYVNKNKKTNTFQVPLNTLDFNLKNKNNARHFNGQKLTTKIQKQKLVQKDYLDSCQLSSKKDKAYKARGFLLFNPQVRV